MSDKIREIKKSESERRKRIDTLKQEIDRFSALAANEPAEADTPDLDRQIVRLTFRCSSRSPAGSTR